MTNPIVDPREAKTGLGSLSNVNPLGKKISPEEIDSLMTQPVEPLKVSESSALTNANAIGQMSVPQESLQTIPVEPTRGSEEDPVLTNMQTFQFDDEGQVRFVMTKKKKLKEQEFVLNIPMPRTPKKFRSILYTFVPK